MLKQTQACPSTGSNLQLSPLPSPASLPGSLGGLPRQAEGLEGGTKSAICVGSHVRLKDGRVCKVQRISKHGVVTLVNTCGGFVCFSHLVVLELVK